MRVLLTLFSIILTLIPQMLCAQNSDSIPICVAEGMQRLPQTYGEKIVDDGEGGTVVVFEDLRAGHWDIYAQRVSAAGEVMWKTDGLGVCRNSGYQGSAQIVRVGERFVVVWWDKPDVARHIYAQALNRDGKMLWKAGGVPVCTHPEGASAPRLVGVGKDGVLVVWSGERAGMQNVFMQRLNADGQPMLKVDGVPIFSADKLAKYPSQPAQFLVVAGNASDFYVAWWSEQSLSDYHIMVDRIRLDGKRLWKKPVVALPLKQSQGRPIAVNDGRGGIILAWHSFKNFTTDDLYAQRIDAKGRKPWGKNGVTICAADSIQKDAVIASDGRGGVVAVWVDERDVYADIYAQRVNAKGKTVWQKDGLPVCTAGSLQMFPQIARKGSDEFIVGWVDYRDDLGFKSQNAIYAQRLDLNGKPLGEADGIPIFTSDGYYLKFFSLHPARETLTVIWNDTRKDLGDIYLGRVSMGRW